MWRIQCRSVALDATQISSTSRCLCLSAAREVGPMLLCSGCDAAVASSRCPCVHDALSCPAPMLLFVRLLPEFRRAPVSGF